MGDEDGGAAGSGQRAAGSEQRARRRGPSTSQLTVLDAENSGDAGHEERDQGLQSCLSGPSACPCSTRPRRNRRGRAVSWTPKPSHARLMRESAGVRRRCASESRARAVGRRSVVPPAEASSASSPPSAAQGRPAPRPQSPARAPSRLAQSAISDPDRRVLIPGAEPQRRDFCSWRWGSLPAPHGSVDYAPGAAQDSEVLHLPIHAAACSSSLSLSLTRYP